MRNIILKPWTKVCAALSLALAASQAPAQTVTTIGGGNISAPFQGYVDGHTLSARFNQPSGLALDPQGNYLFLADYNNNVVRLITAPGNTSTSSTSTFTNGFYTNVMRGISHPISVMVDTSTNVFVLNHGSGTNGTLLEYNALYLGYPTFVATNAARLTNATAMTANALFNTIYLTVASNTVLSVSLPSNTVSLVGVITNAGTLLQGIVVLDNGQLALSDGGNNGIWLMNPTNGAVTPLAGFNGAGDNADNWPVPAADAIFNHLGNIAKAGGGMLVIADQGNNRVKLLDTGGSTVTLLEGVSAGNWSGEPYPGWVDGSSGTVIGDAESRLPYGVAVAPDGSVFQDEQYYHNLRHVTSTGLVGPPPPPPPPPTAPLNLAATATYGQVSLTWAAVKNATSYNVKHSTSIGGPFATIATVSTTSYVDPEINGSTNYYVVSAIGAGGEGPNSAEVMAVVPVPPPPPPRVGWFDYEWNGFIFLTVLHPVTMATFNNDQLLAVDPHTNGASTYYTVDGSDPSATNGFTPPFYQDGLTYATPLPVATQPSVVIKAINIDSLGQPSPIVTADFFFQVANPIIGGNNAALFTVSDITSNSVLYYTTDGSDPTNGPPSIGPIALNGQTNNSAQLSLVITSNTLFKVRGFRNGYEPSGIAQELFSPTNFQATSITFGTASGQPHSSFMARPGQFFWAPVTLNLAAGFGKMYSLQFNVTVTNGFTNIFTGNPIQPIVNGAGIDFFPMLMSKVPPQEGNHYPPADGSWYLPIYPFVIQESITPTNLLYSQGLPTSVFVNTNNNLLGIGWVFRTGFSYTVYDTNFNVVMDFDTTKQDLIQYSIAHDTLFGQAGGEVVVGAYSFQVPSNSVNGDQYFIQLGSPSATSDGVGAPGAGIYIQPPALSQTVNVGSPAYLVGDAAPFRWLNAGDFGDTNLDNSDVMQVYQSGLLGVNMPPLTSDLFAAMDSAGGLGGYDSVNGYWTNSFVTYTNQYGAGSMTNLWNGNDLTINQMPFGDGVLDINDLYVTFRRSLDPSLVWFKRYWTNGMFVAVTNANYAYNSNTPHALLSSGTSTSSSPTAKTQTSSTPNYLNSSVVFGAGDAVAGGGAVVQIPLTANVLGGYPLRVLGLNVTLHPLDGSPAISTSVGFAPSAALGNPTLSAGSKGPANINGAWLNAGIAGLSNNASLGTLTVSIPTNATTSSAYAVHFDFVSGSPNGLTVFPKTTYTGLVTTTPRTNSYFGDGIPDSWRLRWFGTIYNVLSASNACPSGDGVPNWKKYIAGVDPNVPNDFPSVNPKAPVPSGSTTAIHWPSVLGKQYVITRATSLFGAPWTVLSTNTGTGGDMEFDDNSTATTKFYRVEILP